MSPDTLGWLIISLAALVIGFSKTGVPGVGILAVVLMVFVTGPAQAGQSNGLTLILLLTGDVIAVAWYRRHGHWKILLRLLPAAAAGIVVGFLIAGVMKQFHIDRWLGQIIGAIVLVLLLLNRWWTSDPERHMPHHWLIAVAVGALAGVTTMLSNAAGPLLVIYLFAMGLDKHTFIGTSAWYFLLLNAFKVPFMAGLDWINPATLRVSGLMAPMVVVGAIAGILFAARIPQRAFRLVIESATFLAAGILIIYPWLSHLAR